MSIWYDGFEVGIAEIDDQHRQLFERMETLVEVCAADQVALSVTEMLEFLDEYVQTHFRTEEELMARYQYPDYLRHKELHAVFLKNLGSLKDMTQRKGGVPEVAMQINEMLIKWFKGHILSVDKSAAAFLAPHLAQRPD
jgi:hemerythrin